MIKAGYLVFFETGSHFVVQFVLALKILLPQPPKLVVLQVCTIVPYKSG
jgi:hypothetical protein